MICKRISILWVTLILYLILNWTFLAMRPTRPAVFMPAASGWSSCTFPIPSSGSGSRNAWNLAQQEPVSRSRVLDQLVARISSSRPSIPATSGTKRYSLEGNTALIPLLDEILNSAADNGAEQAVLAMNHRGRLNVIINIVSRPAAEIFAGFEDVDPRQRGGRRRRKVSHRRHRHVYWREWQAGAHPPGFESQSPGGCRPRCVGACSAKQTRINRDGKLKVLPVLMHGDSAFAGQGITAETLNLANLRGYNVGGTVHIIVNNLIGFTTNPSDAYSSRFSSDLAKRLPIPIFHVNGEDADAVVRAGRMALEYRYEFGTDVLVDLIGFRRHGHSEVDDPTITQPILYRKIKDHPLLYEIYARNVGLIPNLTSRSSRQNLTPPKRPARAWPKSR